MNMHQTDAYRTRTDQVPPDSPPKKRQGRRSKPASALSWLIGQIGRIGFHVYRSDDARAAASGWEITPGRLGLSRTYRDPRFDVVGRRHRCSGGERRLDP